MVGPVTSPDPSLSRLPPLAPSSFLWTAISPVTPNSSLGLTPCRRVCVGGGDERARDGARVCLSTRASRDDDQWVISGQKVWTSGAHYADLGMVVARTDPSLPKHKGLSMFIVDFTDPTVEVKPLKQISGGSGFNEVFFNETRISSNRLLGDLNQGWNLAVSMLMFERVSIGAGGGSLTADRTPALIELAKNVQMYS